MTGLAANPGQVLAQRNGSFYANPAIVKAKHGRALWDGQPERSGFNTVLPPNGPSGAEGSNTNADSTTAVLAPSSHHTGGVHALMADGAVRFISENIDTGNLGVGPATGSSPYGVWGALGTKNAGDVVGEF
jgi:prepilin-type processing-associated H-X9-DG protein